MNNKREQIPPPLSPVWSIWVPLAVVLAALLGLMILTVLGGIAHSQQVGQWSAISVIFLVLPMLAVGLVVLVLLLALVYALSLLQKNMPGWLQTAQGYVLLARSKVEGAANSLVKPFLGAQSQWSKAKFTAEKLKKDVEKNIGHS
ncbi:MAG TPA: hypothetical protein VMC62_02510 [Longilinea sp.]|nr:hypothetical protein [Longilinea sp.]